MKIRIGPYTEYKGLHLAIKIVKDDDDNILLRYDGANPPFEDFEKSIHEEHVYYLKKKLSELNQAYWVQTYGIYKGSTFEVFPLNISSKNLVTITTTDQAVSETLGLFEVKKFLYAADINPLNLEKIWEERRPSGYDLPMPEGMEPIKEINL